MTTKSKHKDKMIAGVDTCKTSLTRRQTMQEVGEFIASGNALITHSISVAELLTDPKVQSSKYVPELIDKATVLGNEIDILKSALKSSEDEMVKTNELAADQDEEFLISSLTVSGNLLEAIDRFSEQGATKVDEIEKLVSTIKEENKDV